MSRDSRFQIASAICSFLMLIITLLMDWVRIVFLDLSQPISGWAILNALGSLSRLNTDAATDMTLQLVGINETLYLIIVPLLGSIFAGIMASYASFNPDVNSLSSRFVAVIGILSVLSQLIQLASGVATGIGFWLVLIGSVYFIVQAVIIQLVPEAYQPPENLANKLNRQEMPQGFRNLNEPSTSKMPIIPAGFSKSYQPKQPIRAWLIDVNNRQHYYQLFAGTTTIGRADNNDIVINLPQISRNHAEVYVHDGQFSIENKSQSGTFVNQRQIYQRQTLRSNDVISFASYQVYLLIE